MNENKDCLEGKAPPRFLALPEKLCAGDYHDTSAVLPNRSTALAVVFMDTFPLPPYFAMFSQKRIRMVATSARVAVAVGWIIFSPLPFSRPVAEARITNWVKFKFNAMNLKNRPDGYGRRRSQLSFIPCFARNRKKLSSCLLYVPQKNVVTGGFVL